MVKPRIVHVAVVGEAGTGKSSLVAALSGNTLAPSTRSGGGFWSTQFKGETGKAGTSFEGKDYSLHLTEVVGSRGRMSNYSTLKDVVAKADVVLYCVPMAECSAWKLRALNRVSQLIFGIPNRKCKMVVVGTKADQQDGTLDVNDAALKNYPFAATSSFSKQGLDALPLAIMDAVANAVPAYDIVREEKEKAAQLEAKRKQEEELKKKEEEAKAKEDMKAALATILTSATIYPADAELPAAKKARTQETNDIAPVA